MGSAWSGTGQIRIARATQRSLCEVRRNFILPRIERATVSTPFTDKTRLRIRVNSLDATAGLCRQADKKRALLCGRTIISCFFENSTRTRISSEVAGKGEALIDTATTLNAMHPDVLVVRHPESGAVHLLSEKVDCAVVNAGDGSHEHPTQALLDALTIRRRKTPRSCTRVWLRACGPTTRWPKRPIWRHRSA
jgi:hypothetical protein